MAPPLDLIQLWHRVNDGPISAESQSQASAPSKIPPMATISGPGAGLLASLETFPPGYNQASRPDFAGELDQVLEEDVHYHSIPTLAFSQPLHSPHEQIPQQCTFETNYSINNISIAYSPEIGYPDLSTDPDNTSFHIEHNYYIIRNGFPARITQGSYLDSHSSTLQTHAHILNMSTIVNDAPGSPPELSGSRSSKSSSYSSTFSTPDGFDVDSINFEDIGLGDESHITTESKHARDISIQSIGTVGSHQELMRPRESTLNTSRPQLPQLDTHGRRVSNIQGLASARKPGSRFMSMKRGFTTPETTFPPSTTRTRSISPPHKQTFASASTTSLSAGGLRPIPHSPASSFRAPSRRSSWQPQRKTVKELENEYNDSDDELPEDTSLWNVPVSPFLSEQRSHRSSFRGSPERDGPSHSPGPTPLAHVKTLPDTPPPTQMHSQSLPKHRPSSARSVSLNVSTSNPPSPQRLHYLRNGRTKSWNFAMSELSEEARHITEALTYHAEMKDREVEVLRGGSSKESLETLGSTKPRRSPIQLPPIQKSTLDFMPISKEKEAILSRTRPSWLPPKNPKEERKHLQEYQRMMQASIESEQKKQDKQQTNPCEKDETRESLTRIWRYYVEDSTDISTIDKRVNSLCWRGISPNLRGKVWQRAVGNALGLTVKSYERALERAKEIKERPAPQLDRAGREMQAWLVDIERDAETAFPELGLFQRNGPLWQDVVSVCEAYACYRSDVGYVYGLQLIAALLLLQLPTPADAFILMANCLNRSAPLGFQTNDATVTGRIYNHAVSTLAIKSPRIHEYLFGSVEQGGLGFTAEAVFEPMLRTIFCNGLDIDRLCRIWDIWIFEGDRALVRTAVAILGSLQTQIFDMPGDLDLKRRNTQEMLGWGPFSRLVKSGHWNLQSTGDEEKLVEEVRLAGVLDYKGN